MGISGRIVIVESENYPVGTLLTASQKLVVDGKRIKENIYVIKPEDSRKKDK